MIHSGHVTESLLQLECSKLEFFFLILLATIQAADVVMFCSLLSFLCTGSSNECCRTFYWRQIEGCHSPHHIDSIEMLLLRHGIQIVEFSDGPRFRNCSDICGAGCLSI
jgi:hypothetical protein